jgi:hypothetical protein
MIKVPILQARVSLTISGREQLAQPAPPQQTSGYAFHCTI